MKKREKQDLNNKVIRPVLMAESYWADSHLSVVRHTGGAILNGIPYLVVNKEGKDIFECSKEANRERREKAIEPGDPCDLVATPFIPIYRQLGRDKFIQMIEEEKDELTVNKAKEWVKKYKAENKEHYNSK